GNRTVTVNNISFNVNKGEIFGFLGPSGAGKSTTQKVLTGLNRGYSGSVKIDNYELSSMGREYYENIGVSFEFPNLYTQFTAMENLEFFSSFYKEKTEDLKELLKSVGLLSDADKKVSTFSKGMKMRLNFIRAFINKPSLVFLDEPTSGLDPVNSAIIKGLIEKKRDEGTTIFITTHNMQVASDLCNRVAFIVDGEIKLIDSPSNLMYLYGKKEVEIEHTQGNDVKFDRFPLNDLKNNNQFINIINNSNIKRIRTLEATLDDVFIDVTGRSLV
ncbi:MAG: ABC transporter ATP-binding protein, partial [Spirochaetales bacterium]|nr:ABC transporter ATP-binding protein [Spirochaetales bacterium]